MHNVYSHGTRISIFSSSQVSPLYSGVQLERKKSEKIHKIILSVCLHFVVVSYALCPQSTAKVMLDWSVTFTIILMGKPPTGRLPVLSAHSFHP